jgi:hypothetical protein
VRRAERAHLVRYEDLVSDPPETVRAVLAYLEIDSSPGVVEAVTRALTETTPGMEAHRTTPDAQASVGRWQRELTPELQRLCETAFGPALEAFGYS